MQKLIELGYPIYSIAEEDYSNLANNEEGNLYQIVLASTYQIGRIKSYLRRFVEKTDALVYKTTLRYKTTDCENRNQTV